MSTPDSAVATTGTAVVNPPEVPDRRTRDEWPLLGALSITQTIGYGVLYYAFSVLLPHLATDLHTSSASVTGALALAAVVAAAAGVPVGRLLDHHGGRALMATGSVLGVVAVVAWSQVHSVSQLYLIFAVIGLASAMVLYEPAFAVVVHRVHPSSRSSALLTVTIVAGFASSIFLPLTGGLVQGWGWRRALLVLACLLAVTVPLHAFVVPRGRPSIPTTSVTPVEARRLALHDRAFWLLVVGFSAQAGAVAVVAVHLVSYLIRLGHPPTFAAGVAGLLGVLSVTGRLVTTGLRRRLSTTTVTAAVFTLQGAAAFLLPFIGHTNLGAIACVVGFGVGFGVSTIARPAILADRYGTAGYAGIAGTLALPAKLVSAGAPVAAAVVVGSRGGYSLVMISTAIACLAAAALLMAAGTPGHLRRLVPGSLLTG